MNKQKIVASIEARMTSSRLPGKVLMEAHKNISMLEFMLNRVKKSKLIDDIIVATTVNKDDDDIVNLCNKLNINVFRGSEPDVLLRVLEAHKSLNSDVIVELTGDCPLIDPLLIDKVISVFLNSNYDYVSNSHVRSYPDGFDVQVFSLELLDKISNLTNDKYDRENVTPYIYKSDHYSTFAVIADKNEFWPDLRVTLDDKGDYLLIKNIIDYFSSNKNNDFSVNDVINYIKDNKELLNLNKNARVSVARFQKIAKTYNE